MKVLFLTGMLFIFIASCFAQDSTTDTESTVTEKEDLGKYNLGTESRDQPTEAISHPCPYTCNDAGYSRSGCREWQDGDTCLIGPKFDRPQSDTK